MRMIFKQRIFSWFDSYDIYDEYKETLFTVEGKFAWGKKLVIKNAEGEHIATLRQKTLSFRPAYLLYVGEEQVGVIRKDFSLFKPSFSIDCNGWEVDGDFFEWDYSVKNAEGGLVATIAKKIMNWSDTYVLDVCDDCDAVTVLMVALAIDAEKSSRG